MGLHTHVPFLITPVHVVMMRSAQGSDVIWLKGIWARAPKGISTSINAAAAVFSQGWQCFGSLKENVFPGNFLSCFNRLAWRGSAKKSPLRGDNPIALVLTRFVFPLSGRVFVCVYRECKRARVCANVIDIEWKAEAARCHQFLLCPTPGPILDQREVMEAKSVKGTPAGKLQKPWLPAYTGPFKVCLFGV